MTGAAGNCWVYVPVCRIPAAAFDFIIRSILVAPFAVSASLCGLYVVQPRQYRHLVSHVGVAFCSCDEALPGDTL